jgi:hypothetical protein
LEVLLVGDWMVLALVKPVLLLAVLCLLQVTVLQLSLGRWGGVLESQILTLVRHHPVGWRQPSLMELVQHQISESSHTRRAGQARLGMARRPPLRVGGLRLYRQVTVLTHMLMSYQRLMVALVAIIWGLVTVALVEMRIVKLQVSVSVKAKSFTYTPKLMVGMAETAVPLVLADKVEAPTQVPRDRVKVK